MTSDDIPDARTGPVRVGVIGTGAMGAAHVDNLARWVRGAAVTQIFDVDSERATAIADEVGAAAAPSAEALIESDEVDAVLIAAPDPLHEPLTLACIGPASRPCSRSRSPARSRARAAWSTPRSRPAGGWCSSGSCGASTRRTSRCARPSLGGSIGRVRAAHCLHRNAHSHPSHTDEGVLVNSMIHEFDCVPVAARRPARRGDRVPARVRRGRAEGRAGRGPRDRGRRRGDRRGLINARYGYDIHTEVTGTEGTVSLTAAVRRVVRRSLRDLRGRRPGGRLGRHRALLDAYRIELGAWVDGIRAGRPTGPTRLGRLPGQRRGVRRGRVAARRRPGRDRRARSARRSTAGLSHAGTRRSALHRLVHRQGLPVHSPPGTAHALHRFGIGLGESRDVLWLLGAPSYSHGVPRGTMSESRHFPSSSQPTDHTGAHMTRDLLQRRRDPPAPSHPRCRRGPRSPPAARDRGGPR